MKKLLLFIGLVVFLTPSLVLSNELKKMDDSRFCKKATKVYEEGTSVWKNIIVSSVNFTRDRVVKEAKKRKLSLTECIKISGKLKTLEQQGIKLFALDDDVKEVQILKATKLRKKPNEKSKLLKSYVTAKEVVKLVNIENGVWAKVRGEGRSGYIKINLITNKEREIELNLSVINPSVAKILNEGKEIIYCKEGGIRSTTSSGRIKETLGSKLLPGTEGKEDQCLRGWTQVTKLEYDEQQKLIEQGLWKPNYCKQSYNKNSVLCLNNYDNMAIALGCGIKRKDVDDCVKRYLGFLVGSSIDDTQFDEIKNNPYSMNGVVLAIEAMNRQKQTAEESNQPSEEEQKQARAQAQAQGNTTSNPVWRTDCFCPGFWDYGNGFGWVPANPIYDKIISGLSIGRQFKQQLYTGSGRGVTINKGNVNIW